MPIFVSKHRYSHCIRQVLQHSQITQKQVAKLMFFCSISLSVPKMLGEAVVLDFGTEGLVDGCNKTRERAEVSH